MNANNPRRVFSTTMTLLAVLFLAGCDTQAVSDAARTSLSSFVVSVFTSAVNSTLAP